MTDHHDFPDWEQLPDSVRNHIHQLERIRRDFVANVSHELRTPLTVIRGYLETILQEQSDFPDEYQPIFEQMYQHSVRMENIIGDLLLLSRLESEDPHQEPDREQVKVADLLQTICQDARDLSRDKGHVVELEADAELMIEGVTDELKSLFSNLIVNAVKYTPADGHITVRWYADKGQAVFSVTDTGIGIAQKYIPRVTERFYRVDKARSRDSGGTGLGLAIAKHVLMRHNATLDIDSELGQGSTFRCCFELK